MKVCTPYPTNPPTPYPTRPCFLLPVPPVTTLPPHPTPSHQCPPTSLFCHAQCQGSIVQFSVILNIFLHSFFKNHKYNKATFIWEGKRFFLRPLFNIPLAPDSIFALLLSHFLVIVIYFTLETLVRSKSFEKQFKFMLLGRDNLSLM